MPSVLLKSLALGWLVLLAGCTSGGGALNDSFRALFAGVSADAPQLNSAYSYLKTGHAGSYAYLALGYTEAHPAGQVEVWYSATRQVIKLQQGRVIASFGLPVDWRATRLTPQPDWRALPEGGLSYTREVDLMPGYRYGRRQTLLLRPIPAPEDVSLAHASAAELSWFEERHMDGGADPLPPVRYGVDLRQTPARVLYSEQCLSSSLCLSFEPWQTARPPVAPPPAAAAS